MSPVTTVGDGPHFDLCEAWGVLPDMWNFVDVADVATDSHDRVFVFR